MACWLARAAGPSRSTLRRGSSGGGLRHQSVRALHGGVDCSGAMAARTGEELAAVAANRLQRRQEEEEALVLLPPWRPWEQEEWGPHDSEMERKKSWIWRVKFH